METLWDRFLGPEMTEMVPASLFMPRLNVAETETALTVTVDLPGLKPEEVHIELLGDNLVIAGERREEKEEKDATFHRMERHLGEFRRTIRLPAPIDGTATRAEFVDGVLTITLPKTASARPQHIPVTAVPAANPAAKPTA